MNASQDFASRYPHRAKTDPHAVIVPKPVKRTRTGGTHKGSRKAVIAQARRMRPEYMDAAANEIFYGDSESTDTVIVFDPNYPAIHGF